MFKKGNNIEEIRKINQEWINELSEEKEIKDSILVYVPFKEDYWKEKYRIVWYNLEPGGYIESENDKVLKPESFKKLLEERNQTIINTSLFIYCLYNKLNGIEIDEKKRNTARKDYNLLMEYMNKVTYMNLLKDCGKPDFGKKWFWRFFDTNVFPKNRERTININNALDPDILIVTGDSGFKLFQQLYNKKFDKNYTFVHNNTLFVSLKHPGRSGWEKDYIPKCVDIIMENVNKGINK